MKYNNIREEALKNKVAADWFNDFDTTEIIGNIDFTVFPKRESEEKTPLLWAEAKTGDFDISIMFVQLVLTIGKARTFDKMLPPAFLAAFDFKKIAFVPYISVQDFFYQNDFNWNVTPSNHETKEFKLIKERIEGTLKENAYIYDYENDEKELKFFIKENIALSSLTSKIKIDKNNFVPIYLRWLDIIKPIIDVNWDDLKQFNISDSDFYLADLFVDDNDTNKIKDVISIKDNLFVYFNKEAYSIPRKYTGHIFDARITIADENIYQIFWKRYKRPPIAEFQDYILERRDLLVPQDIRERKGAFFTPREWVELSQKYLADTLGENWQEEYYVWDCAAGTGNLLAGLTNKYRIWASTLDQADVNVMHDRIVNGANLLENHVFQFDFLNDDFSKLPEDLQGIIKDENKRKKLVIYINPPYAESNGRVSIKRSDVQVTKMHTKYFSKMEKVAAELYAQFLMRIYVEIPNCFIGHFSTLKVISASNSQVFRNHFLTRLEKLFVVPANTFDNVKGSFPIGFFIWNTQIKEKFAKVKADIFNSDSVFIGNKHFYSYDNEKGKINDFLNQFKAKENGFVGVLMADAPDFQHKNLIAIQNQKGIRHGIYFPINAKNIVYACVYLAVRQVLAATWLNDRDQFLFPNDNWEKDKAFQNDCLAFTLFHAQNKITSSEGINHWIPFTPQEVEAKDNFKSVFMTDFIKGKIKIEEQDNDLKFSKSAKSSVYDNKPLQFSEIATAVFDAGRALWTYYHAQKGVEVNASLYDIRAYFQGRNENGRMNAKSKDEKYNALIGELRKKLDLLADKLAPKVYEYGFLKV